MALLNSTGITNGGTIQAEHVTRAIDALTGVSTDTIIATGSFSGSFVGTITSASFATTAASASKVSITNTTSGTGPYYPVFVDNSGNGITPRIDSSTYTYNATTNVLTVTSSFATTASYALNGGGGTQQDTTTLTFFHAEVTNTTSGSILYIGGFPVAPLGNVARIGLVVPFTGTVTNTWVTSYASNPDTATIDLDLMKNSTLVDKIADALDLNAFVSSEYANDVSYDVNAGDVLNIRIVQNTTSSAIWNVNVGIVIKRD
jgi:hypothetical protein